MGLLDETTPENFALLSTHAAAIRELKAKCNELEGLINGTLSFVAKTVTSLAYTVTQYDFFLLADATDGEALYILPNPEDMIVGIEHKVKKLDASANKIILQAYGATLVDNATTVELTLQNEVVTFVTDGTNIWTT